MPEGASADATADLLLTSLRTMIAQVGDTSNLVLDDNLDSYYLMDITVNALPRSQQRLSEIILEVGAWLREQSVAVHRSAVATRILRLHQDNLDHVASDAAVVLRENGSFYGGSATLQKNLPPAVASYVAANEEFADLLDRVLAGEPIAPAVFEATGWRARAESFRLWQVGADELDRLLAIRIGALRRERTLAFEAVGAALALAALVIGWVIRGMVKAAYLQVVKTNEELAAKEAQLRAIGDNLPDAVVYQSVLYPDGRMGFLHLSAGFERITGLDCAAVLRDYRLFFDHVVPEDLAIILEARKASAKSLKIFDLEFRFRHAGGELRWMRISSAPRLLPDGRVLWDGFGRDITERKLAEAALRESEGKFSRVFQASPDAIVISDLESGEVIEANASYARLYGYPRAQLVGRTTIELGIFEDPLDRQRLVTAIREQGAVRDWEVNTQGVERQRIVVLFSGELIELGGRTCLVAVVHDITERRRREIALRESEEKFAKIFQASPDAIVISDLDGGPIIEVNPSFAKLFGYSRAELVGQTGLGLQIYDQPQDRQRVSRPFRPTARSTAGSWAIARARGH